MTQDLKTKIAEAIEASPDGPYAHEWAAQAALQAIHDAGFAVVPREPTEAMTRAPDPVKSAWCWRDEERFTEEDAADIYQAMLAASKPKTEKT